MKKTLAIALAVFATSAIAEGTPLPTEAQGAPIHDARTPSLAGKNDQQASVFDSSSRARAPSQVLYEVTLSRDGKLLKSLNVLTDDGKQGTAASEEIIPYLTSCDAATGCSTGELRSAFSLSLTPRVGADGSILTSCTVDISTSHRADDFSTTSEFFMYHGQEMTISHDGLLLTIKATVV
ncbi:hypothetical protein BZM26_09595 [Paraburkholderia strydomiana]|nr:hypothetical protein BZM26_09595 [Paraburkholderia strydomiana]